MFKMDKQQYTDAMQDLIFKRIKFNGAITEDGFRPLQFSLAIEEKIIETLSNWQKELDFDSEIIEQFLEEIRLTAQIYGLEYANAGDYFAAGDLFCLSYIIVLSDVYSVIREHHSKTERLDVIAKFVLSYQNTLDGQNKHNDLLIFMRGYVKYWSEKEFETENC